MCFIAFWKPFVGNTMFPLARHLLRTHCHRILLRRTNSHKYHSGHASKKAEDYSLNPTIISIFGAIFASIEKNEFNNKCNYKAL